MLITLNANIFIFQKSSFHPPFRRNGGAPDPSPSPPEYRPDYFDPMFSSKMHEHLTMLQLNID